MALWKSRSSLFTLGGRWDGFSLKEVQEYSMPKNNWKSHSQLPEDIFGSSAVVLNEVIYNMEAQIQLIRWCGVASIPMSSLSGGTWIY